MAKVEIKTTVNNASVTKFIESVADRQQRDDAFKVVGMMQRVTGEKPRMWGDAIIGFGERIFKSSKTTREVDIFKIGFSPRKGNLSLYVLDNSPGQGSFLEKLGKHKTSKWCLLIKRLSDVDEKVLEKLMAHTFNGIKS